MAKPNRDQVLTIDDVPALPEGTATVYKVATTPQYTKTALATLNENGVLVSLDDQRCVFDSEPCEVLEVYD